jgi:hypothetical protein
VLVCCGCTSLKPIAMGPESLQQQISSGELVKPGDTVRCVTADGKQYDFEVTAIGNGYIEGEGVSLPISGVVAVEKRKFSLGKTALLGAGTFLSIIAVLSATLVAMP